MHGSRCAVLILLVLTGVSFADAPATSPATTQATYTGTPEQAQAEIAKAKARVKVEQKTLDDQIAASEEIKKAEAELAPAEAAYEQAKKTGTVSDRMTTGAAMNKIKQRIAAIKVKMLAASGVPAAIADVHVAEGNLVQANAQVEKEKAEAAAKVAKEGRDFFLPEKLQAIQEHRIMIGMTEAMVKQSWPEATWVVKASDASGKVYEVTRPGPPKEVFDLTIEDGKLTDIYRHDLR